MNKRVDVRKVEGGWQVELYKGNTTTPEVSTCPESLTLAEMEASLNDAGWKHIFIYTPGWLRTWSEEMTPVREYGRAYQMWGMLQRALWRGNVPQHYQGADLKFLKDVDLTFHF